MSKRFEESLDRFGVDTSLHAEKTLSTEVDVGAMLKRVFVHSTILGPLIPVATTSSNSETCEGLASIFSDLFNVFENPIGSVIA